MTNHGWELGKDDKLRLGTPTKMDKLRLSNSTKMTN